MRGKFITFEGGEGAGKTTQAARLGHHLTALGIPVSITREPGGTPFAERVRALLLGGDQATPGTPLAETLLFYAARADHVARVIEPALAAGRWVISDRFADSTRAYQGAAGGVPTDSILELERVVLGSLRPDLTFVLDLPAESGLARAAVRWKTSAPTLSGAQDPFETRDLAFHERLRRGFLAIAAAEPGRFSVIDAARPLEEVTSVVVAEVRTRLGAG